MNFESLPKHFFHSLKFKMLMGFTLMFACIGMMNWISMDRLQAFEDTSVHNTQVQLPNLEAAALIQTQIAKLSGLVDSITRADSQAKVRILAQETQQLLAGIKHQLSRLKENNATSNLADILQKLETSLAATAHAQNRYIIQDKILILTMDEILEESLTTIEVGNLEQRNFWIPIVREITLLSSHTRLFEIVASERKIKRLMSESKTSFVLLDDVNQDLLKQVLGDVGLFHQLKERESRRNQLASINTQNKILLDSINENILRFFDQKSQEVYKDSHSLVNTIDEARFNYYVIVAFGLVLFVLSLFYLKEILFSRLIMLSSLIRSGNLTKVNLRKFDLKNEIGDIALQLSNYLTTIDEQRNQLKQASEQLADVIRYSKLRIAIVQGDNIVYHNQSFPRLFDRTKMKFVQELPTEIARAILSKGTIRHTNALILQNFHSEVWQRWFDVSSVTILWEGKESSLVSLVDVTDREIAAREFKETISLVEKESQKDALTGLYNRKVYTQTLKQLDQQAKLETFALFVCDIDNFKAYNDCYGHQKGDDAIRAVAQTLSQVCRAEDVAIRYGGEEFVLVLFNRSHEAVKEIGKTLIKQVYDLNIEHQDSEYQRVTISIGVAIKEEKKGHPPREVFELADQRLYIAKNMGRNQSIDQHKSMQLEG